MRHLITTTMAAALVAVMLVAPGCSKQMVQVETGEIVLCTEGHVVSDTVELREVPADEVADHGVTTRVITCDFHEKLAALYEEAERSLAAGDLEAAKRAFEEIAEEDPSFRNTSSRLASLRAGGDGSSGDAATAPGNGTPGGSAGGGSPGGSGDQTPGGDTGGQDPVGPIANLTHYIPDRIPGFVGQSVTSDPFVLFRDYLPEQQGSIVQLSVEVEQFGDIAHARRMLDERVRRPFPTAGEDISIGSLEGYIGTRPNYVRLGMLDRGIMVSLEFYTTSDNPAEHKDAMIAAARAIAGQ